MDISCKAMYGLVFAEEIRYKLLCDTKKERSSCQISFAEPLLLLCITVRVIMQNDLAIDVGQKW